MAHVVGDLARLVDGAACEQHRELVAADARHGVRIAQTLFDQRRDLAQQIVAGDMAGGIIHELEAVEVEIAHHVTHGFAASRIERGSEPPLELRAVHEAGQRIVAGLV